MDGTREQELEQRIDELEATVRGLTEELVDLNERVRDLENDADIDTQPDHAASMPEPDDVANDADQTTTTEPTEPESTEEETEEADDIIVA